MFSQKFQMNAFITITVITYILYIVSLLGLTTVDILKQHLHIKD